MSINYTLSFSLNLLKPNKSIIISITFCMNIQPLPQLFSQDE